MVRRDLAAAIFLLVSLSVAGQAYAQRCTWGGTSPVAPPSATSLRAYRDLLHAPGRVAADGSGRVYVTDPAMGQVVVKDRYGKLLSVADGFDSPLAIAVDKAGRIYVGDRGNVSIFDQQWNLLGKLGQGDGEFLLPNDIAVDPDPQYGRVYVSDSGANAIRVYSADGGFLFSFGGKGTSPGQFDFPTGVYVSADGEVFVGDQNNDRVQVFDRAGKFLRCFGSTGISFSRRFGRIQGLTGDLAGRLYVADAFQGYVQVFDRLGVPVTTIGSFGEGPGQLRTPMGLAIDTYNRLFIAAANNARVEVFGLDNFTDPHVIPAVIDMAPGTLKRSSKIRSVTAYIEIRDHPLENIDLTTITANGILARPSPVVIGDHDADGIPDLMVRFDAQAVLATLPDGEAVIVVSGAFTDGTAFEGTGSVRVISRGGAR